jgi:hypothetical protein
MAFPVASDAESAQVKERISAARPAIYDMVSDQSATVSPIGRIAADSGAAIAVALETGLAQITPGARMVIGIVALRSSDYALTHIGWAVRRRLHWHLTKGPPDMRSDGPMCDAICGVYISA